MTSTHPTFYYDFIDPLSRLMARELTLIGGPGADRIVWMPFELRPPPTPLTTRDDAELAARWAEAGSNDHEGRAFSPPLLVPWTRKAHELVLHAAESNRDTVVRDLVFDAYLLEGRDIGRVDVLVDLARTAGLDTTETKAVLDVDRFEARVSELRAAATGLGIDTTPSLRVGDRLLRGFHNAAGIRTFLGT